MSRLFIGTFATLENYELLKYELEPFFEGRWVKEKNLHITFKFLGEVQDVNLIIEKLKNISYPKKQTIIFKRFRLLNKKTLVLRSSNKTLYKLQNIIEEYLQDDFKKEEDFKPHITLMRIKKIKDDSYKEKFKTLEASAIIKLKICLVQSELGVGGAKYKIIREF
ncbi:MAG: RNA 2',3'-cyclic phosphodiesterase [Arcobacteraceae bacterium]|nr:RNA 2',3'-cyclic phosphodiesterase [Arcobacteraceae bacterium]